MAGLDFAGIASRFCGAALRAEQLASYTSAVRATRRSLSDDLEQIAV